MKKAIIAAAVAGAFAVPSAMAADLSVNLEWGQALQFGETTTTAADGTTTSTDIQSIADAGRNRIKWNWTETLDNGIGVHAYLVFGNLATSNGGSGASNAGGVDIRNAFIAFSGDFGTIHLGTNENFFELDMLTDVTYGDYGATADKIQHINLGQTGFNFTRRDQESIWFHSKSMNGFDVRAAYIMGVNADANADEVGMQIGLRYNAGPLTISVNQATYEDFNAAGAQTGGAATAGTEAKATSLNVTYDMGVLHIQAAMWDMEQSGLDVTTTSGANTTAVEASGSGIQVEMPTANGIVFAALSSIGDQDATRAGASSAIIDSGRDSWDVGYLHNMSSETYMFVRYGQREDGLNFTSTAGSVESDELLFGWLLNYYIIMIY